MEQNNPELPPPNDYAARFGRPGPAGPAPQPAASAPATAAPRPHSLAELFEASLTAPLRPWAAFAEAAARPAPGLGTSAGNVAAFAGAFFALNLVRAAALFPSAFAAQPPERVAIVAAVALVLAVGAGVAAAGALQLVAAAVGGGGGFLRSLQAVSMLGLALPLEAAALWYPPLAPLPVVLAAIGAAAALEKLHGAPALAARGAAAVAAAAVIGSGWVVAQAAQRALAPYAALQQTLQQAQRLQQSQAGAGPAAGAPASPPAGLLAVPAAPDAAAPGSSLGLVAAPAGSGLDEAAALPKTAAQADRAASAALGGVAPLLNGAAAKDLPPEQRAQLQQLGAVVSQLQNQLGSGRQMTPQQQAQMLRMIQQAGQGYAAPPAQPSSGDSSSR